MITDSRNANMEGRKNSDLVGWIMNVVSLARKARDNQYKSAWDAYERTYRGFYSLQDKTREGERSKIIAPALMQAVDSTSAAIEDAIFSRDQWFDAVDDINDKDHSDVEKTRLLLNEDFELANVPDAIAKTILYGCLYGTGIAKLNVIKKEVRKIMKTEQGVTAQMQIRPLVTLTPIPPWEFVIDSHARTLEDALFVAHETAVPRNVILSKIKRGIYSNVPLIAFQAERAPTPGGMQLIDQANAQEKDMGAVQITEYYGRAPAKLVAQYTKVTAEDLTGGGYVEVIATIANESELLRVVINPFLMKDRPIIAYQHDHVPGKFWGRGVAEKAWNPQRGLDAELRMRMDTLSLLAAPMLGADITRLPRNPDMRVRPGKVWLTRGRPSEVLEPILLGQVDPNTFNQSSEMERLVQVASGSIESNAPLNVDRRNETASGISMIQSSALKRMRRTMWNIERQFLNQLIRKATWRYIQFNPQRYPADYEFEVKGTMGIVAREFEQANLTALLSVVPPDSPQYNIILKGVIELSGTPKRDDLLKAIDESMKPNPMSQKMQEIAFQKAQAELMEMQGKAKVAMTEAELNVAKTEHERKLTSLEDEKVDIQAANSVVAREKARATFEQNQIQRDRNDVDREKNRLMARKKPSK